MSWIKTTFDKPYSLIIRASLYYDQKYPSQLILKEVSNLFIIMADKL